MADPSLLDIVVLEPKFFVILNQAGLSFLIFIKFKINSHTVLSNYQQVESRRLFDTDGMYRNDPILFYRLIFLSFWNILKI
jgi:hypothetical protein